VEEDRSEVPPRQAWPEVDESDGGGGGGGGAGAVAWELTMEETRALIALRNDF
jgi:hypothetical protein